MKKAICICFLVISLFCSCAKKAESNTQIKVGDCFSCTTKILFENQQFTCDLTYKNSANASLKVVLPEQLKDISFTLTNGELFMHYGENQFPVSSANNTVSTAKLIFTALSQAMSTNSFKTDKDSGVSYTSGEVSSHKYRLNFNTKSGLPESFEIKSLDFFCEFSNFKFL